MSVQKVIDIFGPGANPKKRVVRDLEVLCDRLKACRALDLKIVLTSGTFDLTHVGHLRYLERAKEQGDVLIVGVDSDEKVRERKGPNRPIVDETERMEILCHSRYADLVYLKPPTAERWSLIKAVRPDVLIATQESYKPEELAQLREFCGEIIVLEPQATASTTARIRSLLVDHVSQIRDRLQTAMGEIERCFQEITGQDGGAER